MDRKMNDSTMPPPPRKSVAQPISSANTETAPAAGPRQKVPSRRKGFGLSDWNRLVKVSKDLAQLKGKPLGQYSWDEIKKHDSVYDGWMVLRGKVYFISPYLAYHPGGESILKKVLGKDATELYDRYHRWVNEENLIGKLLIGYVETSRQPKVAPLGMNQEGFAVPTPRPPKEVPSVLATKDDEEETDEVSFDL